VDSWAGNGWMEKWMDGWMITDWINSKVEEGMDRWMTAL
jgi:hypothetical protein